MKKIIWTKAVILWMLLFVFHVNSFAQSRNNSVVEERNVRAEMGFLAGDAMQGRGSATIFERIAAEYIGSQFMQFGLEPAGEKDASGNPTFVQTVEIAGRATLQDIKTSTVGTKALEYRKDFFILSLVDKQVSGPLQKMQANDTPKAGSVVLVTLADTDQLAAIQAKVGALATAGVKGIILTETTQFRDQWTMRTGRTISLAPQGANVFVVSKEAASALSGIADGSNVEISGQFTDPQASYTWNAMGKITGRDATLGAEIILLTSHLDHLGVRANATGDDKIFNGADDDASGSTAVLELARLIASGQRPKRTVYFVCFGSEEAGGHGARYFVDHLPFPQDKLVANLEFEMIGRPDAKVKPEELWLTGYDRSNLGPELAKRGAKLVDDPHPDQNFFFRSDNITLARKGIIAHTVSSFGLHTDYHHASDEVKTIDFQHMTRSINSMVAPIQWLINSNFKPTWNPGKKP
jgi:hypothetical protein